MQTISHICLFQYKDGNLLGVVGTDVPMKEIINLAPTYQVYFFAIIFQNYISVVVYWSKVLTDQQGLCRYFWKHKIVKNLKTATTKQVIIHLSNLLKCFFQKKSLCNFFGQKWKVPYPNTRLQFHNCWLSRVLDIQDHTFFYWFWMEKKVLIS